jgi:UDP-glucuronate 4-epimerase
MTEPKTILVTGANGLIGYELARTLQAAGNRVVAVDRTIADIRGHIETAFELEISDVHKLHDLATYFGVTDFVHCGGVSGPMAARDNPAQLFHVNIGGTTDMAELARQTARRMGRARLVFCSSLTVYGDHPEDGITETTPIGNHQTYAASKVAGEAVTLAYANEYGVDAIVIRIAGVYGPRRKTSCVIRLMVENALRGRPTRLSFGKGFPRQWVYVDDVAGGLALVVNATGLRQRVYNLSGGVNPTIDEAAALVREFVPGAEIELAAGPDPEDITLGLLDIGAARRDFGYEPKTSLRDGIRQMIEHISTQEAAPTARAS